jgi:ubiquitin conjugation factor E4 B
LAADSFYRSREPNPAHDTLVPYLLNEVESDNGLCMDFMNEAVARLDEDETIAPLFSKGMADISSKLATLTMNHDYKPYVNVSCRLVGPEGLAPCC